jgi:hypothetical protein
MRSVIIANDVVALVEFQPGVIAEQPGPTPNLSLDEKALAVVAAFLPNAVKHARGARGATIETDIADCLAPNVGNKVGPTLDVSVDCAKSLTEDLIPFLYASDMAYLQRAGRPDVSSRNLQNIIHGRLPIAFLVSGGHQENERFSPAQVGTPRPND